MKRKEKKASYCKIAISVIACLASLAVIIFGVRKPILPTDAIGICSVAGVIWGIVQAIMLGLTPNGTVKYYATIIFLVGYYVNIVVGALMVSFCIEPLWQIVFTSVVAAVLQITIMVIALVIARVIELTK